MILPSPRSSGAVSDSPDLSLLFDEPFLHPFDLLHHLLLPDPQLVSLGAQLLQLLLPLPLDRAQALMIEIFEVPSDLLLLDLRTKI